MKLTRLTDEYLDFFAAMDPLYFLERAALPGHICIGATVEDEAGEKDIPAGLMILDMNEGVTVEWICVAPERRKEGIGGALMRQAFEMAADAGESCLYLYTNEDYDRGQVTAGEEDFLEEYDFEKEEDYPGEWVLNVLMLSDRTKAFKGGSTLALEEVDSAARREINTYMLNNKKAAVLCAPQGERLPADPDISRVMYEGKQIKGVLLARHTGGTVFVTGFMAGDKSTGKALIADTLKAVKAKYGSKQQIRVIKRTKKHLELLIELSEDGPIAAHRYSADVENYFTEPEDFMLVDEEEVFGVSL